MRKLTLILLAVAGVVLAALAGLGCSGGNDSSSAADSLVNYDQAVLDQYAALNDEGYAAMQKNDFAAAKTAFAKQAALIPAGRWGHYNLACAYSREGDIDGAFACLDTAVTNGWTDADHLGNDTDLQPLQSDTARFTALLQRVRTLHHEKQIALATGLPRPEAPAQKFADTTALIQWLEQQQQTLRANNRVRHSWQAAKAQMELEAQRLIAMETLLGDNFDYDLERIVTMGRLRSPYEESWGPICATIMKEVDAYTAAGHDPLSASQARYYGIIAAIMTNGPAKSGTPEGQAAYTKAETYFGQMDPASDRYGAAEAWLLGARLTASGDTRADLYQQVRDFTATYGADPNAMNAARILMAPDIVKANWPLPLAATDIDGKQVSLASYKGKVVLVDFWATWCPPCRAELPYLKAAYEKYQPQGFEILSISLDYPEQTTQDAYRAWITENGMNWRHVYDEKNWDSPLTLSFAVGSIPSPFLIGKDGSLVGLHDECRGENLAPLIEKALAAQL